MAEFPLIVEQALAEVKQTTVKMVPDRILQQLQLQNSILHSLVALLTALSQSSCIPLWRLYWCSTDFTAIQLKGPLKDTDDDTYLIAFKPFLVFFMKH